MAYRLIDDEPPTGTIEHVTFVAFLPDGACAALPGPALISGAVLPGEPIGLDASVRIPLETAGFFRQRVRVFAVDGTHAYAWLAGDRYAGQRPHAAVDLLTAEPARLAEALDLLVSRYAPAGGTDRDHAAEIVRRLGFPVAGSSGSRATGEAGSTAWINHR